MKKSIQIALLLYISSSIGITACPTCVGRISQESPPFFSDGFYQTNSESTDQLYEQLLKDQQQTASSTEPKNQKVEQ